MDLNILSEASYIVTVVVIFVTSLHLLTQRKKPTSIFSWVIIITIFPYIGILLYIIFHDRKLKRITKELKELEFENRYKAKKEPSNTIEDSIIKNLNIYATKDNYFYLCKDGVESYHKLVDMLEGAKKSIYISTYIFANDATTEKIINILAKKAKEGVEVKLLIDAIGSFSLEINPHILKPLKDAGGKYHFFMSLLKKPLYSKLNLRNHRKMIIVDHIRLMSGGINISNSYLSKHKSKELWVDISFIIRGGACYNYEEIFLQMWQNETREIVKKDALQQDSLKYADSSIHVVASGPDLEVDAMYEALLLAIYEAKEKIWILSPYFLPDSSIMEALIIARHKGVEVTILSPKSSDHFFIDIARDAYLRELYYEGAKILFLDDKMLHAKAMLIDDKYAVIGSANFDSRSFFYNFEVVSFLYSKDDIKVVENWIEHIFKDSKFGMSEASKVRLIVENFFKIFSPAA